MNKNNLKIITGILLLGLFCGIAMAAPSIIDNSPDTSGTITGTVGATQEFSITLNESGNVVWTENGVDTTIATDGSNVSTLDHTLEAGSYQVIATVEGTSTTMTWNVEGTALPSIIDNSPENSAPVTGTAGTTQAFTVTLDGPGNVIWTENGVDTTIATDGSDVSTLDHTFEAGSYQITATVEGSTESITWDVEGTSATTTPTIIDNSPENSTPVTGTAGTTQAFTVTLNASGNVIWTENGVDTTIATDGSNVSTLDHTFEAGSYQVIATVEGSTESITWDVEGTSATTIPTIIDNSPENSAPISGTEGDTQEFTVTLNASGNVIWTENGVDTTIATDGSNVSTLDHTFEAGSYQVIATVEGSTESVTWDVEGEAAVEALTLTKDPDKETVEISEGKAQIFNITGNQNFDIKWFVDGTEQTDEEESDVNFSSFTFDEGEAGETYEIKAEVENTNVTEPIETIWTLKVLSKYYSSGNRIWDENLGLSEDYTWNALSYSGFYYDLNDGEYSEYLTINDIGVDGREIGEEDIKYVTSPLVVEFEYGDWDEYQVIGFMAERYFAGYIEDSVNGEIDDDLSLIKEGVLSKVLTDSDDELTVYSGSALVLEEGYTLNIIEVDVNGDKVWVQLEKDGVVVDDGFLTSDDEYVYEADLGDAEDVPVIIAHLGTVFAGAETSAAFVEGLFQISDSYIEVERGDDFGEMTISRVSGDEIEMENEDDITLEKGETIELMGKIQIQVADDNDLRFGLVLDTSEPGTYELRGTVYDEDENNETLPTWTPFNFEGFYYNIDEGIGTEELRIDEDEDLSDSEISDSNLIYTSEPEFVEFEHGDWGEFQVIGFMAEKYFAGYDEDNTTVEGEDLDMSLLSENILSKVLIDSDEEESMYSGSALILEEGYALNIKEVDINGEKVWVQLEKDGKQVDDGFISAESAYVYEADLGDVEDVPLIIVNFEEVFAGAETNAVFVEGIFQISDEYEEIDNGDTFGEMEVKSIGRSGITMRNDDDITLEEDETIDIMGDVKFKVADDNTLRFYPFVEIETEGGASRELKISVPKEIIVNEEFEIEVTAGEDPVEDVTIKIDGKTVGETDDDGILEYEAEEEGTIKVTAEKEGYTTANKNIEVIPPKEEMIITVSPDPAYIGDTITIEVVEAIGGKPIKGAEVSIDDEALDETGSDGTVTYSTDDPRTIKVSVAKEGFLNESKNVKIRELEAIFEYSNLLVDPLEVRAGKDASISVDVENTGNAAGDTSVELVVNGTVAESQTISLGIGESTTVNFKHAEEVPGTYEVKLGGQTTTYTVLEKTSALLYAFGALILALAGGAAYMFTKGGWTVAMLQEKVQELIDSVKPKK